MPVLPTGSRPDIGQPASPLADIASAEGAEALRHDLRGHLHALLGLSAQLHGRVDPVASHLLIMLDRSLRLLQSDLERLLASPAGATQADTLLDLTSARQARQARKSMPRQPAPVQAGTLPACRLLVVDDMAVNRLLLQAVCQELGGLEVEEASDGASALARCCAPDRTRIDVVVTDLRMPGMDGFAVRQALKAEMATRDIPVSFLSAHDDVRYKLDGFSAGAVDYISKPFQEADVLAQVFVHFHTARRLTRLEAEAVELAVVSAGGGEAEPGEHVFRRAVALLKEAISRPLRLDDLADKAFCSERRLNELFRQRVGMTVHDYAIDLRLETGWPSAIPAWYRPPAAVNRWSTWPSTPRESAAGDPIFRSIQSLFRNELPAALGAYRRAVPGCGRSG